MPRSKENKWHTKGLRTTFFSNTFFFWAGRVGSTGVWIQGLTLARQALLLEPHLQSICPGWLWTVILLIFASWVARIIGMSCQCPASHSFWIRVLLTETLHQLYSIFIFRYIGFTVTACYHFHDFNLQNQVRVMASFLVKQIVYFCLHVHI
jgi:hypothetical protein